SLVGAATLVALVLLWPGRVDRPAGEPDPPARAGTVTAVRERPCDPAALGPGVDPATAACGDVSVRMAEGPERGRTVTAGVPSGPGAPRVAVGDKVRVMHLSDGAGGTTYSITDHHRVTPLWLLGAAFALAVVAFGRWRGLRALAGLAVTFAVLLWFIVPAILDGRSPVLVAVVGAAAIMLVVLYLTHGFTTATTIAVAGTLASLVLTAVLAALATGAAHLSGVSDETSSYLDLSLGAVNMRGLLLAGIVIGALGVLDDVTVTQAATVGELAHANPGYRFRHLYQAATRVGRAHIASVINTIVLAYAGASLPLLVLFAAGDDRLGEVLTSQLIAEELVRAMVGTIGLVAAVPVTTALAAAAVTGARSDPRRRAPRRPGAGEPWMAAFGDAPPR
ncbi:MAG TPA: YibE/F family protein, partial [Pilimelia sp.]|nr:YibE/F family protein [Pilimelia sp.]